MLTRRGVLQAAGAGALTAATGSLLPLGRPVAAAAGTASRPADAGTHPPLTKFSVPLPILPTARPTLRSDTTDFYVSRVRDLSTTIYPGTRTAVSGYFGRWVPPVIRARRGRRVVVQHTNASAHPISVHLHGGVNAQVFDGEMSRPVAPGDSMAYVYENAQDTATLWMHDHTYITDAQRVYAGMASPYLIGGPEEDALGLPSGAYDIPLMLRDGDFDSSGQLIYTMDDTEHRSTVLVNGRPWPYLSVEGRKYRFRFVNASNMRFFVLGLSDGTPMTQIAGDCGLLSAPASAPVVVISPGERAEVVIDFSQFAAGTDVDLVNYLGPGPMEDVGQVMRFKVGAATTDPSRVPPALAQLPALKPATVQRSFTLKSSEPGETPLVGTINGKRFDMDRIDTEIRWGTTEEWEIVNANATVPHNFHTHLAHFRVVARSDRAVGPDEGGWKDTVQVYPGASVKIRLTFDRYRGVYPYHCHMLDHAAMGMMALFRVR